MQHTVPSDDAEMDSVGPSHQEKSDATSLSRVDDSTPTLPLLSLPVTASSQSEPSKRRPLPTPPPSSSRLSCTSEILPAYPPPPYSFTPDDVPMSRDLSRLTSPSPSHATPGPEAPVIMPPLPVEQGAHARPPYDSFLCHSPPANTWIVVETSHSEYVLLVRLPGFRRDGITIATRRRRVLHVVADSWEPEGGHFERRVSFGYDAELAQVRAEFDGDMLRIIVPRHPSATSS